MTNTVTLVLETALLHNNALKLSTKYSKLSLVSHSFPLIKLKFANQSVGTQIKLTGAKTEGNIK